MNSQATSPIWHPFTQHGLQPHMVPVRSAEGAWLETTHGQKILDAISSWWVITHGHCHPKITEAIARQLDQLHQVIFAGFTHEPATQVANHLVDLTPGNLTRVFFSDSGSTSVEVALKMALGYWHNIGHPRTRIAALEHGYHGDTIGTMSTGARGVFNAAYEPVLFDVVRIPFPHSGKEQQTIDALDSACRTRQLAAFVVEPLILGAGGMLLYPAAVLAEMKRVCDVNDVLFIADEVMTGWGRTGSLFACEQAEITPDILCLAKGITGGALPLAVTLCSEKIFSAHLSQDRARMFFHSSSYTANPVACAAAVANMEIWKSEPVNERIANLSAAHQTRLNRLKSNSGLKNIRHLGTIAAVDFVNPKDGYLSTIGPDLYAYFLDRGVLLRPLGNTLYVMPPYCITETELDSLYDLIDEAARQLKV